MKILQLLSLAALLAFMPVTAQAAETGRNYGTYQGSVGKSNPSNYGSDKAAPVVAAPATATGVAAPAGVAPGTPVAATVPVNTPAAAAPIPTPVIGAPQTVPPVFQDAAAGGATPTAAPAVEAPVDSCATYMYDNNAYQSCKDMQLKIERMKSGSKARNQAYKAQAPAPAPAAPAAAPATAPAAGTTPAAAAPEAATAPPATAAPVVEAPVTTPPAQ